MKKVCTTQSFKFKRLMCILQVDSGQTIATISRDQTGSTVATLNTTSDENAVDIAVGEVCEL